MADERKYEWGEGVYTLLSWFKQDRVKNAHVLVAGAGALGNEVVKNLALFGVGHITVVDFDRIEVSNLTRSVLFREEDAFAHAFKAKWWLAAHAKSIRKSRSMLSWATCSRKWDLASTAVSMW